MKLAERAAPVAAAVAALSTLACCLPLGIAGAAGALGLSVVLSSLRPWLIAVAVILLAVGVFQLYRGREAAISAARSASLATVDFMSSSALRA